MPFQAAPAEPTFESPDSATALLSEAGYLASADIASVVFLAERLRKPILVEGPAGTGKTELAKALSRVTKSRLIRLQCYEGLDEAKALYEWDYKKQLLRIQSERMITAAHGSFSGGNTDSELFSPQYLLTRPLLEAISAREPVTLLIDEVDRVDVETEALFLEVLSDYQVSIPELGTIEAEQVPIVILTSNATRELSEALRRRCLYIFIGYPDIAREQAIVQSHVPEITDMLAEQIARTVGIVRTLDLKKDPSVAETIDWARTLLLLGADHVNPDVLKATLHVLLKHQTDLEKVMHELSPTG